MANGLIASCCVEQLKNEKGYNLEFDLAAPNKAKIPQENSSTKPSDGKRPVYRKLVASISPLITGPTVCPMSIVMSRKPMAAPTRSVGTSSLIKAGVEAVTEANPSP